MLTYLENQKNEDNSKDQKEDILDSLWISKYEGFSWPILRFP